MRKHEMWVGRPFPLLTVSPFMYAELEKAAQEYFLYKLVEAKMSRRIKKTIAVKTDNEELIKQVFELYKPNKVQLFFLKAFGPADNSIFTGNKKRVKTLSKVLNMTEDEVRQREMTMYLGFKGKSKLGY